MLQSMPSETVDMTPRGRWTLPGGSAESPVEEIGAGLHAFHAIAFAENLSLRDLAAAFPGATRSTHELRMSLEPDGELFAYPFGTIVFRDVPPARREAEVSRLRTRHPQLAAPVVLEA